MDQLAAPLHFDPMWGSRVPKWFRFIIYHKAIDVRLDRYSMSTFGEEMAPGFGLPTEELTCILQVNTMFLFRASLIT